MNSSAQAVEVPAHVAPKALVALLHVAEVDRSIGFYQKLGFELGGESLKNDQGVTTFVWMHHGDAIQIMLSRAGHPLNPGGREVMFYLYVTDMPAYREQLQSRGIATGELTYPFWSPKGEFRIEDPDGWVLMVC
jgi:predicted enzyme related to lactoylglutathione lyase